MAVECLLRRTYDPESLVREYPPRFRHPHKQLAFSTACPPGAPPGASFEVTRWASAELPATVGVSSTEVRPIGGHYDYDGEDAGVWHVNFADPQLFVAYGSALLAQDEFQAVEHPLLGSIREALIPEGHAVVTLPDGRPTPVLVRGVERRVRLATEPDVAAGRPLGLYGNRFAVAPADVIQRALHVLTPPTRTNLIAIAALGGGRGPYWPAQIARTLQIAFTGFSAAAIESRRAWPGTPVEIRTGFWGCGAFGGNRQMMSLLQVLAAQLAGIERVRFYVFDERGAADCQAGLDDLERVLTDVASGSPMEDLIERIADLDYAWGVGDGT